MLTNLAKLPAQERAAVEQHKEECYQRWRDERMKYYHAELQRAKRQRRESAVWKQIDAVSKSFAADFRKRLIDYDNRKAKQHDIFR